MNRTGLEKLLPVLAVALVAGYYACLLAPLTVSRGIWVNDEGNRMLQIEAFASTGGFLRDPLAGHILSGLAPFAPGGYMVREPDQLRIVSGYTEAFPFLSAQLFRLGGFPLCRVAVLLAGLACSVIVGRILLNASAGPRRTALGILLTGAATPLLFYSGTLLEITLAALLTSLVFLLIQTAWRNDAWFLWLLSGLTASLVLWFREEGALVAAAILLSLPLFRRREKLGRPGLLFAAGFLPGTAALLLFNFHRCGSVFGLHHLIYRDIQPAQRTVGSVLRSFWFFLFEPASGGAAGIFCAVVFLAALLVPLLLRLWKKAPENTIFAVVSILLAAAAALNAFFLFASRDPMEMTLRTQSLLATVPFALLPLLFAGRLRSDPDPFPGFLLRVLLIASAGIALLLEYNTRGLFFGPRHFTLLLPLFAVLTALCSKNLPVPTVRLAFLAVCLISALCQFRGVLLLKERKDFGNELNEICRNAPVPLILTDLFFVPEELASLRGEPPVLWLQSEGIRPFRVLTDLAGLDQFLFLTGDRFAAAPDLLPSLEPDWQVKMLRRLENPDMSMLSMKIYLASRKHDDHERKQDRAQPQ